MKKANQQDSQPVKKKASIVSISEDDYALTFKITKEAWETVEKKRQREIKSALRDLDDLIYTLLESEKVEAVQDGETDS